MAARAEERATGIAHQRMEQVLPRAGRYLAVKLPTARLTTVSGAPRAAFVPRRAR